MSDDETPIPGHPLWNEKALGQYASWIATPGQGGGQVDDDEANQAGDAPELRWALGVLVSRGILEATPQGQGRTRYRPRAQTGQPGRA